MQDDFAALDLLSIDAFGPSSAAVAGGKKKGFGGKGRKAAKAAKAKRGLTALLPVLAVKAPSPSQLQALQGWPVTLSWPTREFTLPDLWANRLDGPAS